MAEIKGEIVSVLNYIDIIDCIEFLEALYDKIYDYSEMVRRRKGINNLFPIPIELAADRVLRRIHALTPSWYRTSVDTSDDEIVNGYALTNSSKFNEVSFNTYKKLCKVWDEDDQLTYTEFVDEFKTFACSEWCKMDPLGVEYSEFWHSEDPDILKCASHLTRQRNMEMVWKLPFPKRFIFAAIEIGCSRNQESVRDCNHFGVWFERKRAMDPGARRVKKE